MWVDLFGFVVAVGYRADLRQDCHKTAADIRFGGQSCSIKDGWYLFDSDLSRWTMISRADNRFKPDDARLDLREVCGGSIQRGLALEGDPVLGVDRRPNDL